VWVELAQKRPAKASQHQMGRQLHRNVCPFGQNDPKATALVAFPIEKLRLQATFKKSLMIGDEGKLTSSENRHICRQMQWKRQHLANLANLLNGRVSADVLRVCPGVYNWILLPEAKSKPG
jgi:hypothetical protein